MAIKLGNLGQILERTTRSLVVGFAPQILGGVLTEIFRNRNITVAGATEWVEQNKNLWEELGLEHQQQIKRAAGKLKSLEFVNAEWAIESLRNEMPALASLFLGWRKAHNWLERQLDNIKKQAMK